MGLRDFLNTIKDKDNWSFWSFILALLALLLGGLTIYLELRDRKPELRFEVVSNTSVLDVREELDKLKILYDGRDIKKSKQSLRVVVVRVVNPSDINIRLGDYDEKAPLGLAVSNGVLLGVELLKAGDEYLDSNLSVSRTDSLCWIFEPVILDGKASFTLEALILHAQDTPPKLRPQGKIAGITTIKLIENLSNENEKSYWHLVFAGGVWVQAMRLVSYTLGFCGLTILLFAIIFPILVYLGYIQKWIKEYRVFPF